MVIDDPEEVVDVSDPEDDVPIASPVVVRAQPRCQSPRLSQLGQQTEGGRGRGRGADRRATAKLSALTLIFLAFTSARAAPIARGPCGPHCRARPALAPPAGASGLSDGWQLVS